ncbi:hypothetical protein FOZ60_001818 [Perkinsus olseni]|uniref:Uncharacterized protein n=2 Tax=Perkinsus olseni TaxID=32597 RepID=A0A7J6MLT9_PEROL|nr:hypothetical protein FOZ60_001818 [Perkinsus olseni]KAF4725487.1 hypothetical protein FOZ62_008567 [Perkinsus olseni]
MDREGAFSTVKYEWFIVVEGMLVKDPAKRMSLEDILRHPWIRQQCEHPEAKKRCLERYGGHPDIGDEAKPAAAKKLKI